MGIDNPLHIVLLLIIALLVFGAKRLPEMGRSLGSGMRGFKEALSAEPVGQEAITPEATASAQTAGDRPPARQLHDEGAERLAA